MDSIPTPANKENKQKKYLDQQRKMATVLKLPKHHFLTPQACKRQAEWKKLQT
jgi:hypothetical protein